MSKFSRFTNYFDSISDMHGRMEFRKKLTFDLATEKFANSLQGLNEFEGVVLMMDAEAPGSAAGTIQGQGDPTHPWVRAAVIRPLNIHGQLLEEPCKHMNDRNKLIQILNDHPIAYSETLDGDENIFIPTVGDVVKCYYDISGPKNNGQLRGLRFKMRRVRRAEGGFDANCLQALGAKLQGGKISLASVGNPGGILGGGAGGTATAGSGGTTSGVANGKLTGEAATVWPSGVIGVFQGESIEPHKSDAYNWAIERMNHYIKKFGAGQVKASTSGSRQSTIKMTKPNILTIVDTTMGNRKKRCWTFDISNVQSPKVIANFRAGHGGENYNEGWKVVGGRQKSPSGPLLDYANGNNHTSAGMKVFSKRRRSTVGNRKANYNQDGKFCTGQDWTPNTTPGSECGEYDVLMMSGIEPWNTRDPYRGAWFHKTYFSEGLQYGKKKMIGTSKGCLVTNPKVHHTLMPIVEGGSWLYVYTGVKEEWLASNVHWQGSGMLFKKIKGGKATYVTQPQKDGSKGNDPRKGIDD